MLQSFLVVTIFVSCYCLCWLVVVTGGCLLLLLHVVVVVVTCGCGWLLLLVVAVACCCCDWLFISSVIHCYVHNMLRTSSFSLLYWLF